MFEKALHTFLLLSFGLSTTAVIVVYFWCNPNVPHLLFSEAVAPTLQPTPTASNTWRSSLNNEYLHQEQSLGQKTSNYERSTKSTNNTFLSKDVYKTKKVKVLLLPNMLPYAAHLKSIQDIQQASWPTQLHKFLKSLKHSISPQVNMVFGDSLHLDLVLNWIIAAHLRLNPPLHNIMVLSVDQPLCDFLASKKLQVTCIAVPSESILASTGNASYAQGIKSRLIVLRVINFWGYDVASYDSDAVLLRNPQHLFDSNPRVQVFGGASYIPHALADEWRFTNRLAVCGGSVILRSHPSTENLWRSIHNCSIDIEQYLLNHVMRGLGVEWKVKSKTKFCSVQSEWQHYGHLATIVFPQNMFCRQCCKGKGLDGYYVVHPTSNHLNTTLKHQRLKELRSWFLQDNWRDFISSPLEGNTWLYSIYDKELAQ